MDGKSSLKKNSVPAKIDKPKTTQVLKVCLKCFQVIGKGKKHPCVQNPKIAMRARKNIEEIIHTKVSVENQERIAAKLIKTKYAVTPRAKDLEIKLSNTGLNHLEFR